MFKILQLPPSLQVMMPLSLIKWQGIWHTYICWSYFIAEKTVFWFDHMLFIIHNTHGHKMRGIQLKWVNTTHMPIMITRNVQINGDALAKIYVINIVILQLCSLGYFLKLQNHHKGNHVLLMLINLAIAKYTQVQLVYCYKYLIWTCTLPSNQLSGMTCMALEID